MRRLMIAAMAALLLCAAPSFAQKKLVIVHTNDTHSHLDPSRDQQGGVIERAAFIDQVRKDYGRRNVLFLHAGDFNQGTSYFSMLHGDLEVSLVNALGYDCVTLGNHEFDNGIEDLARRVDMLNCPVVCANYDFSAFPILCDRVKPYVIVKKAGKKIGIIGELCDLASVVAYDTWSRIPHLDDVLAANLWAKYLKEEMKCDMVLILSHMGYEEEKVLAAKTENVDIIVGGHSHTRLKDVVYVDNAVGQPVGVVQDGYWGLEMGMFEFD